MKFGWVDFSRQDREKVMSVIDLLREPGTLDELGVGPLRDGFANFFFPGTSTIQTRAKYFLVVPYILQEAVSGAYGTSLNRVLDRINDQEHECGKILYSVSPNAVGIVGSNVLPGGWVKRTPASIYWNGIVTYGIYTGRQFSMLQAVQFGLRRLADNANAKRQRVQTEDASDDNDAGQNNSYPVFDLPTDHNANWRTDLDIELTSAEAEFLAAHIEKSVPNSLLAYILKHNISMTEFNTFHELYCSLIARSDFPSELAEMMRYACEFEHLAYGTRILYNLILSNDENKAALREWASYRSDLANQTPADISLIMARLNISNIVLKKFLCDVQKAIWDGKDDEARTLICKQELFLKKNRAKTLKAGQFKTEEWYGGKHLDFRMPNAGRILDDIYAGRQNHV